MIQEVKAMKKFLSIMIMSAMLVSAVSCSNVAIMDDTSGSETTASGTASPEISTDSTSETTDNVSEDQNGASEESEPSAENDSSDSTPSEYSIADYSGEWSMDGGAGTNTMRIFSNGTWNTVYADGSSSNGTYTASDSEIAFNDEHGNTMTYESGNLVDQAGYAWIKSSAVPY